MSNHNPFKLTSPCFNCPFRNDGAIELQEGRLQGIIESLGDDRNGFPCHKTVHAKTGGTWSDDDGSYNASGKEQQCAGAMAYLMKMGRQPIALRIAFMYKSAHPHTYRDMARIVIDPMETR